MSTYKDLIVYQKSIELCVQVYNATNVFPKSEIYGITSQIRRSSVAIPSNIAEGQSRGHKSEYVQFLRIAFASGAELETQLQIAQKIDYLDQGNFDFLYNQLQEIMRMLNKLLTVLHKPVTNTQYLEPNT